MIEPSLKTRAWSTERTRGDHQMKTFKVDRNLRPQRTGANHLYSMVDFREDIIPCEVLRDRAVKKVGPIRLHHCFYSEAKEVAVLMVPWFLVHSSAPTMPEEGFSRDSWSS